MDHNLTHYAGREAQQKSLQKSVFQGGTLRKVGNQKFLTFLAAKTGEKETHKLNTFRSKDAMLAMRRPPTLLLHHVQLLGTTATLRTTPLWKRMTC